MVGRCAGVIRVPGNCDHWGRKPWIGPSTAIILTLTPTIMALLLVGDVPATIMLGAGLTAFGVLFAINSSCTATWGSRSLRRCEAVEYLGIWGASAS